MFGIRLDQIREQLHLNHGDMANSLGINGGNWTAIKSDAKDPPWIKHVANFVKKHKLDANKLYWLITGKEIEIDDQASYNLPKSYVIQTNKYIKTLENKIKDLEHQREYFETALMEALKTRELVPTTQQNTHTSHRRTLLGHKHVEPDNAGKNRNHTSNALP